MSEFEEVCHKIVNENWTTLAAFAWQSFLSQGQGYVLVHVGDLQATEGTQAPHTVRLNYVARPESAQGEGNPTSGSKQYDPTREIVVVLEHEGEDLTSPLIYRSDAGLPPPDAYRLTGQYLGRSKDWLQ